MNGAQALVEIMIASGVRHIFGLPGDTGTSFYDALWLKRDQLTHVMTRDERSASFMADAYARVSGRLGVCEGPSGGGATYILPGVAEAQGSAIPMLCLTSDTPVSQQGQGVLTELDQEALFRAVTKWNTRINSSGTLPDTVRRAIRLAMSGRPGAVHLSLPSDILEADGSSGAVWADPNVATAPAMRTRPDPDAIVDAAQVLANAERPVIVAGGGVLIARAWDELTSLSEALDIPVATSINGKGSIAETHRVSIGVVGGNGGRPYAMRAVAEADVVFFIGSRTDSTTTDHWSLPSRLDPPVVIHLDSEPREIGNTYRAAVGLHGDAKLGLKDLLAAIDHPEKVRERNRARMDALVRQEAEYWEDVERQAGERAQPIKPQQLIQDLRQKLDDDVLIVADPGTPTPYLAAQFEVRVPGRSTVIPRAHGGLGYALPAVVGAKLAAPERQTVVVTADGSFGMSCGELETISRLNMPVTIIQCSNATFGWIKELQHLYHGDRYFSVDFNPVDYAAIARGFGLRAWSVTDPADLSSTLDQALADGGPTFVDVMTESQITETPPVAAWERAERARVAAKERQESVRD